MGHKKHPDLKKDIYLEIKLINFFKMMNKLENKKKEFFFLSKKKEFYFSYDCDLACSFCTILFIGAYTIIIGSFSRNSHLLQPMVVNIYTQCFIIIHI